MQAVTFIFAFVAVLALIVLAAWLVRRFANNRLGANTNRGRMPRLAVIDAAAVDGRRRLVLVRRDNVEHLLLIGGPTDIVVEPNIDKAAAVVAATVSASPALRDIKASPSLESLARPQPSYEPLSREPIQPISREPVSREPPSREPLYREHLSHEPSS